MIYKNGECEIQQNENTLFDSSWYKNAHDGWAMGDEIGCHRNELLIKEVESKLNEIFNFMFIREDPYAMDFTVNKDELSDLSKDELQSIREIRISQIEKMDLDMFPYQPENNEYKETEEDIEIEERSDPASDAWNDILDGNGWKHGL